LFPTGTVVYIAQDRDAITEGAVLHA
jgi:hypothetical protein